MGRNDEAVGAVNNKVFTADSQVEEQTWNELHKEYGEEHGTAKDAAAAMPDPDNLNDPNGEVLRNLKVLRGAKVAPEKYGMQRKPKYSGGPEDEEDIEGGAEDEGAGEEKPIEEEPEEGEEGFEDYSAKTERRAPAPRPKGKQQTPSIPDWMKELDGQLPRGQGGGARAAQVSEEEALAVLFSRRPDLAQRFLASPAQANGQPGKGRGSEELDEDFGLGQDEEEEDPRLRKMARGLRTTMKQNREIVGALQALQQTLAEERGVRVQQGRRVAIEDKLLRTRHKLLERANSVPELQRNPLGEDLVNNIISSLLPDAESSSVDDLIHRGSIVLRDRVLRLGQSAQGKQRRPSPPPSPSSGSPVASRGDGPRRRKINFFSERDRKRGAIEFLARQEREALD